MSQRADRARVARRGPAPTSRGEVSRDDDRAPQGRCRQRATDLVTTNENEKGPTRAARPVSAAPRTVASADGEEPNGGGTGASDGARTRDLRRDRPAL